MTHAMQPESCTVDAAFEALEDIGRDEAGDIATKAEDLFDHA